MPVRQVDGVALLASEIETEPIEDLDPQPCAFWCIHADRRLVGQGLSDVTVELRHRPKPGGA